ncbi:MAG: hypothetical protein ACYCVH_06765 [Ignavibacteriaceae bacterium]
MVDLKEFIEIENINKSALSDMLGITRTTLYTWLDKNKPDKREKIIQAISQLAANLTKKIEDAGINVDTTQQTSGGVQVAGVMGSQMSIDSIKENENLKQKIALLEEMIKSKDDQISLLKELLSKEREVK